MENATDCNDERLLRLWLGSDSIGYAMEYIYIGYGYAGARLT